MSPESPIRVLPPWLKFAYRLISWWDVNEFSARYYLEVATTLEWFAHQAKQGHWGKGNIQNMAQKMAEFLAKQLASMGCKVGSRAAARFAGDLVFLTANQIQVRARELRDVISSEMEDVLFLYVDSRHKEYYEGLSLFGDEVEQAFPSSNYDIAESGKCIALNRSTAAVCHLMRVLEWGLRAMATKLKVRFENKPLELRHRSSRQTVKADSREQEKAKGLEAR